MLLRSDLSVDSLRQRLVGLPALLGLQFLDVAEGELRMRVQVAPELLAPNGYLHAGTVVALADTTCGFACVAHLPQGAESFTTIELKTNFLGTATSGSLIARAHSLHLGRTTQVWDATVSHVESGRTIAEFRCTQLILWPKAGLT
jgi:1,4-dihydroxy-2-naphthoyl-CoA hydrolase